MRTAQQMKERLAQQKAAQDLLRDEAVEKMSVEWIALLDRLLEGAYAIDPNEGGVPVDEVYASSNRFDFNYPSLDRSAVEVLAAGVVLNHFNKRGFPAYVEVVGTTPHQRVTVTWV